MNERIKELVNLSYETIESPSGEGYREFNKEKFAELIIQECCNTILEFDYDYCTSPNKAMLDAAFDVKQRFGVKR